MLYCYHSLNAPGQRERSIPMKENEQKTCSMQPTSPLRYAVGMFGTSIPVNMFKTYAAFFYVDRLGLITTPLNPVNLIDGEKQKRLRGYLSCGLKDDLLICTRRFQEASQRAGLPNRFTYVPDRGHDWTFWEEQIPLFFDFITEG